MNSSTLICSLCQHEIPATYLRAHREQEAREMEQYTIDFIKSRHPDWTENDPTCQKCWDQYEGMQPK